jgi:FecR protein
MRKIQFRGGAKASWPERQKTGSFGLIRILGNVMALIRTLSVAGTVLISAWAITSAQAQEVMGSVAGIAGTPSASGAGGSRRLSVGGDVFEGDRINVGPGGNAQLLLSDGTKLVVGPSSQLVLQSYLLRNASTAKKVSVKALRGTFRFITGNSPKNSYDISTSNATIGIRGTAFDFNVGSSTVLAVLEGSVKLKGRNGQSVNTEEGCHLSEAGTGGVEAREIVGEEKSNGLTDLPYIVDQTSLGEDFKLDTTACLAFLPNNGGAGISPVIPAALVVPLVAIPPLVYVLTNDNSISDNGK